MASIDLKKCDGICESCVFRYIKKHKLQKGEVFEVSCKGIPKEYITNDILGELGGDKEVLVSMLDPVTWAAKFLDWHCLDPDGAHWHRKTIDGTLPSGADPYDAERALLGKSIFHRPYQAEMLRCTSNRKVLRLGRQTGKTECLTISMLFNLFINPNFKIVVIAPYQAQIDLIFKRLSDFIASNIMLQNSIKRNVKAPNYNIELYNGSMVTGFTAGTRSGQDAGASRGQSAQMLVFDEADMLSSGDIDAALAIISNYPQATVWVSSTPTGRRETFFRMCSDKEFREFHYPSHCNPNWSIRLENFFKKQYTQDGYLHEILAEFGEQEEGVYKARYVELAQADYEYGRFKFDPNWTYMFGVDWNDFKIGTTLAVVGYNPVDGLFYLVAKDIISKSEGTQLESCRRIAEYNRIWNPAAIYVDRGYGATQIEVLKKFGADSLKTEGPNSPNAKLRNIVKPYDFGGTVEIRDLFTKQPIDKKAKPFLVENSVRRFEQESFKYPKSDENYTSALLGYIVNRVTSSGVPVYEQQNESAGDHFLDAVNLALVAFTLEKSDFGQVKYDYSVNFSNELTNMLKGDSVAVTSSNRSNEGNKPQLGRAAQMEKSTKIFQSETGSLPASNTSTTETTRLWSWPGWHHDAPRPQRQSSQGRRGYGGRVGVRPKRSKF